MGIPAEIPYGARMQRHRFTIVVRSGFLAFAIGVLDMATSLETPFSDVAAWLIGGGMLAGVIGSAGLSVTAESRNARERYAVLAAATVVVVSIVILTMSAAVLIFFDTVLEVVGATGSLPAMERLAIVAWFALWASLPAAGIPLFMTWRRRRLSASADDGPVRARCRSGAPRRMR
jgi:hypothetical protein